MCPVDPNPEVVSGNTAELSVYAAGYPPLNSAEIRWRNPKGELISLDSRVSLHNSNKRLVVRNAGLSDSGSYTIEIYREVITAVFRVLAETVVQLDVHGK